MTSLTDFSRLVGSIYDSALDPACWPVTLERLAGMLDAKAAVVQLLDPVNAHDIRLYIEHGTDSKWTELLHTTYAALCPIIPLMFLAEVEESASIFDYIDEGEFRETRFYREWCLPQDYYDMAGALLSKSVREVGSFSVIRSESKPRFGPADLELLGTIAPHMRRAVTIAGLLEHRAVELDGLKQIMDRLQVAVFIVNEQAQIQRMNAAADELVKGGSVVFCAEKKLGFLDGAVERQIRGHLAERRRQPIVVACAPELKDSGQRATAKAKVSAAVLPLDPKGLLHAVILHAPDPMLPASGKPLVEAFGFTPREIAVLFPLIEGKNVGELAEILGISMATARTHVQRLLEKTGTSRQSDLVRVVMQAMPPVRLG